MNARPQHVTDAYVFLDYVRWLESPQLLVAGGQPVGRPGRKLTVYEARTLDVAVQAIEYYLRKQLASAAVEAEDGQATEHE